MDPNFIKLFRLSQLIIEYLLVRTVPFLPLSFITLPPPLFLSLSLRLSPPLFSFTQHSQQYLSEQGHTLEKRLQQSQQVMKTVYVPVSLVTCNNFLRIVSPSPGRYQWWCKHTHWLEDLSTKLCHTIFPQHCSVVTQEELVRRPQYKALPYHLLPTLQCGHSGGAGAQVTGPAE